MTNQVLRSLWVWVLMTLFATNVALADDSTTREKLAEVRAMIARQETNVQKMQAELRRNPNRPDARLLRNSYATATGSRSAAYAKQSEYMRGLIDAFEGNTRRNVSGAVVLVGGFARSRAQFIVELDRSNNFIDELRVEERRLVDALSKEGAPHIIVEVRDFESDALIADATVTIRKTGGSTLSTGANGEAKLLKGTHVPDGATKAVDIAVAAKGYEERWTEIDPGLMTTDAGRYTVHLKKSAPAAQGTWRVSQRNFNGATYTGNLVLTQQGDQVFGSAEWDNHVRGTVTGTFVNGRLTIAVQYAGDLVGHYSAELSGSTLQNGGCHDNKGSKPCTWTADRN